MIDTGKMLESVERLERVFGGETRATQSIGEVRELLVNLRQAEKDAARYRWLDEQNKSVMSKVMVCNGWIDDGDDVEYVSDIASFIDEAMQCK